MEARQLGWKTSDCLLQRMLSGKLEQWIQYANEVGQLTHRWGGNDWKATHIQKGSQGEGPAGKGNRPQPIGIIRITFSNFLDLGIDKTKERATRGIRKWWIPSRVILLLHKQEGARTLRISQGPFSRQFSTSYGNAEIRRVMYETTLRTWQKASRGSPGAQCTESRGSRVSRRVGPGRVENEGKGLTPTGTGSAQELAGFRIP